VNKVEVIIVKRATKTHKGEGSETMSLKSFVLRVNNEEGEVIVINGEH